MSTTNLFESPRRLNRIFVPDMLRAARGCIRRVPAVRAEQKMHAVHLVHTMQVKREYASRATRRGHRLPLVKPGGGLTREKFAGGTGKAGTKVGAKDQSVKNNNIISSVMNEKLLREFPNWLEKLNEGVTEPLDVSERVKDFAGRLVESGRAALDSGEKLSRSKKEYLIREMRRYHYMRKEDLPGDVYNVIEKCERVQDWEGMLKVYDAYFGMLVKVPLVKFTEKRDEICREMQEEFRDGVSFEEELNGDNDDNGDNGDNGGNGDNGDNGRRLYEAIEKGWYKLDKPRNLNLWGQGQYQLVLHKIDKEMDKFNSSFIDDFFKDLLNSEIGVEYEEMRILLKGILRRRRMDVMLYEGVVADMGQMGMKMTPEMFLMVMEASIQDGEKELTERVLHDYAAYRYLPERRMARMMMRHYSYCGDVGKVLQSIDMLVEDAVGSQTGVFEEDLKEVVDSLVRIGFREEAIEVIKALIVVQELGEVCEDISIADAGGDEFEGGRGATSVEDIYRGPLNLEHEHVTVSILGSSGHDSELLRVSVEPGAVAHAVVATSATAMEAHMWLKDIRIVSQEMAQFYITLVLSESRSNDKTYHEDGNVQCVDEFARFQELVKRILEEMPIGELEKVLSNEETVVQLAELAVTVNAGIDNNENVDIYHRLVQGENVAYKIHALLDAAAISVE